MSTQGGGSIHDLIVESWVMYSIGIWFFVLRLYARYKRLRFHFQVEDYLMFVAIIFYTAFVVTNIEITKYGSTLYEPGQFESFTAHEIQQRILGSKIEFASEHCQVCTIYCLKACMLLVYFRITSNLKEQRWVRFCAVYTALGWIATELTLFLNCHPVSGYWTLPPPQRECATYFRFEIIHVIFNISSDIAILLVILPMLFRTHIRWQSKLPIVVIFSMGIVVILCAVISKIFTFIDIYDTSYQFWYLREASIGVWITNAPFVWSLARSTLSILKSTSNQTKTTPQYNTSAPGPLTNRTRAGSETRSSRAFTRMYDMEPIGESEESIIEMDERHKSPCTSAASIDENEPSSSEWGQKQHRRGSHRGQEAQIWKTTEIVIEKT
ncbi:hypothetical protein N7481_009343 [Penicillium waksmanii]|uniref:uncharacterized protein n=1 Tax=Penicillium waksmanii TaxID=69791 RepID=UPI0025475A34|nr:uncharacterized protein N7481_009343 [Penicillium waksmanii]KAJ5975636.1 hypothetical protein N7481_009343 [Penicillium waksmanii]